MVYTLTFNPAIDYMMMFRDVQIGSVNRSYAEDITFGGKGINVSCVLAYLGVPSVALGFVAGFTGQAIEQGLCDAGIKTDFVRLKKGNTRINVKVKSGDETDLNGIGPEIDDHSLDEMMHKLCALGKGDTLVLAGSIPGSMPSNIYEQILDMLSPKGVEFVVDARGDLLAKCLKYKPFLVKPNNYELGEIFGVELFTFADIEKYAVKMHDMGAKNVLVSMAGDGSLLVDEYGQTHILGVCRGEVINSVGAGDSMVAGFLAGYYNTGDYTEAQKLGTAAGGATTFSAGLGTREQIYTLLATL